MPRATPIIATFNAGELTPLLAGRTDINKYHNGCNVLENMFVHAHGPAERRPGTYFVAEVKTSAKKTRLVPFEFSTEQAYILEFGHQYIRFYKDQGQIQLSSVPYEIATTYQESELFELKFAQSADILYITHPDHPPRKLSRTGHTAWTLTTISFQPPPTSVQDIFPNTTLTPGATSGTGVTFTAGSGVFQTGDVDRQIISGSARAVITAVPSSPTNPTTCTCDIIDDFPSTDPIPSGSWSLNGSPTGSLTPDKKEPKGAIVTLTSALNSFRSEDVGKYIQINSGFIKITTYTSMTTVKGEILKKLTSTDAATDWTLESEDWNATNGYPAAVTFFEERLCFARGQTIWGSVMSDYENMTPGADDDDAIDYTISANQVNIIRWLEPAAVLMIGTVGGEWKMGSTGLSEPVTPTNVFVKRETTHGSADLAPVTIGGRILFVQRAGRKLREIIYDFQSDSYPASDCSILAEHITAGGITEMTFQQEPYNVIWCVRGDGVLLGMTHNREQEVYGWHRHITDGEFESVAVIPGSGDEYELWVIVKRTINGATKRYVEYFKAYNWGADQADCFFVDSGLTYSGSATTTISGLSHLEGKEVAILADGAVQPSRTVSSGSITLSKAASKVHAGLPYTSKLQTMRIDAGSADGTAQGKKKRIHKVTVRLYKSLGFQIGSDENNLDTAYFRSSADEMDAPPELFTGDKDIAYPKGHETNARPMIVQAQPLPLTVIAMIPRIKTND